MRGAPLREIASLLLVPTRFSSLGPVPLLSAAHMYSLG